MKHKQDIQEIFASSIDSSIVGDGYNTQQLPEKSYISPDMALSNSLNGEYREYNANSFHSLESTAPQQESLNTPFSVKLTLLALLATPVFIYAGFLAALAPLAMFSDKGSEKLFGIKPTDDLRTRLLWVGFFGLSVLGIAGILVKSGVAEGWAEAFMESPLADSHWDVGYFENSFAIAAGVAGALAVTKLMRFAEPYVPTKNQDHKYGSSDTVIQPW